jgi:hypothetical protein
MQAQFPLHSGRIIGLTGEDPDQRPGCRSGHAQRYWASDLDEEGASASSISERIESERGRGTIA